MKIRSGSYDALHSAAIPDPYQELMRDLGERWADNVEVELAAGRAFDDAVEPALDAALEHYGLSRPPRRVLGSLAARLISMWAHGPELEVWLRDQP